MKKLLIVAVSSLMFASCSLTLPVTATSNEVGSKVGISKTTNIGPFFFGGGDASIRTAAKRGNLTKISTVDFKQTTSWFFIHKFETIVTGE